MKKEIGIHVIQEPSPTTDLLLAKLEMQSKTVEVVNPKDKEQMRQIAFEQPSIPFTNPYADIIKLNAPVIEHFSNVYSDGRKKFRKQNNRKHKKSRK